MNDELRTAFERVEGETACIYRQTVERALWAAINRNVKPFPLDKEIATHCRKLIYPDGMIEWTWRDRVILRQLAPKWNGGDSSFAIQFETP